MPTRLGGSLRPAVDRVAEKIALTEAGCIEWLGGLNGNGYGRFHIGKTPLRPTGYGYVHRWSYEYHVGPIPAGFQIDHLCGNRKCVNPEHLEPVTAEENVRRAHARTTHCPAGHLYSGENLYVPRGNQRACRECGRERNRRNRRNRKAV